MVLVNLAPTTLKLYTSFWQSYEVEDQLAGPEKIEFYPESVSSEHSHDSKHALMSGKEPQVSEGKEVTAEDLEEKQKEWDKDIPKVASTHTSGEGWGGNKFHTKMLI